MCVMHSISIYVSAVWAWTCLVMCDVCVCVCVCVCVDACYIVSFAIIMLNTSLHNPNVKKRVSYYKEQQFLQYPLYLYYSTLFYIIVLQCDTISQLVLLFLHFSFIFPILANTRTVYIYESRHQWRQRPSTGTTQGIHPPLGCSVVADSIHTMRVCMCGGWGNAWWIVFIVIVVLIVIIVCI